MMTGLDFCFLCRKRVLGLIGQDFLLDTYYLRGGDAALQMQAYGPCHAICLCNSRWGRIWATYFHKYMEQVSYLPIIGETDGCVAFRREEQKETTIIQHDGFICVVHDKQVKSAVHVVNGRLIGVDHYIKLNLTSNPDVAKLVQQALVKHGAYPLRDLLHRLSLMDRLIFPIAVENGELRLVKQDPKFWTGGWISGQGVYAQFVPEAMMELVQS